MLSIFSLCAVILMFFTTPFINWQINRTLKRILPEGDVAEFRLSHVGFYRSDISLIFHDEALPDDFSIRIDSCILEYNPYRLFKKEIDSIKIRGLSVKAVATNGAILIPLTELFPKSETSEPFSLDFFENLPIKISKLQLDGGIVVNTGDELIVLPVQIKADTNEGNLWKSINADITAMLASNRISLSALCDIESQTIKFTLNGIVSSYSLPYIMRRAIPASIYGFNADIMSEAMIRLNGSELAQFDISTLLNTSVYTSSGPVSIKPTITAYGTGASFNAIVEELGGSFSGIPILLNSANIVCSPAEQTFSAVADITVGTNSPLMASFNYATNLFDASITNITPEKPFTLKFGNTILFASEPSIAAHGFLSLSELALKAQAIISTDNLSVLNADEEKIAVLEDGTFISGNVNFKYEKATAGATATVPSARHPQSGIAATNFIFSITAGDEDNKVLCRADTDVIFRDTFVGHISCTGKLQENETFLLDGKVEALDAELDFGSKISFNARGEILITNYIEMAEQQLDLSILPVIFPELDGISLHVNAKTTGDYTYYRNSGKGSMEITLSDGSLSWPEKQLEADSIHFTFSLPNFPALVSDSQVIRFKNFKYGKIEVESGRFGYRMYSPTVWFIDNTTLNWCGGKIRGESMRLSPENRRTRITLHADRLKLSELLHQIGIGTDSGGTGTISGTIPAIISKEEGIVFRDAYLYSTPGEEGRIELIPSQTVLDSTEGSIESALAVDALKNFSYSWVKIGLNTQDETLTAKFEMDGKPADELYYSVGKDGIVRSKNPVKFKGIKLDVSFNLPLNETLFLFTE